MLTPYFLYFGSSILFSHTIRKRGKDRVTGSDMDIVVEVRS
uniref:ORF40z n=1 Tax=Pinus koraiensis TaxID=88728 RepID=A4QMG1_PINKO|nr:ORF40z [Pinus koraiensis]ABP35498.1 ORF40z [Pinus koraiensis]